MPIKARGFHRGFSNAREIPKLKIRDKQKTRSTKIAETNIDPTTLASHAARMCYTAESPKLGDMIDVKKRLFDTGHHSTLEHNYWTFMIENIPVSSVVFGLHLTAPFF